MSRTASEAMHDVSTIRTLLPTALVALAGALPLAAQSGEGENEGPRPLDVLVDDDPHQRYLLHGLDEDAKAPKGGWRLLVVLPGGNGSADFAPFVGRIREHALGKDWLIAQIVAPVWDEGQAARIVWPTKRSPYPKAEFTSEELFATVLEDVAQRCKLDERYLFTLAWSSSGPLAYTLALDQDTPVTGTFVAMSVFKPDLLPSLKPAKGRAFYILHSPDDKVCPFRMAEQARDELDEVGADVEFVDYTGGHGWHGDVFGNLRRGVRWLESKAERLKIKKRKRSK
ncbi:MAG TPA: hypothetical protein VMT18_08745 [Planctomycetota bacterium]|nr:hypothetical protein [Planctomycetota bacterium]